MSAVQRQAEIDAAAKKAEDESKTKFWAGALMIAGGVLVIIAMVLAIYSSTVDVKTSVAGKDDPATTDVVEPSTTTVENARLPDSLLTLTLGAGALLFLSGAFYRRVSKIVITGVGEIDLASEEKVVKAATASTGGDPDKTAKVATMAIQKLRTENPRVRVVDRWNLGRENFAYFQQPTGVAAVSLDDQAIADAVAEATTEVG